MGFLSILLIALGLSADCFAVALSTSIIVGRKIGEIFGRRAEIVGGLVQQIVIPTSPTVIPAKAGIQLILFCIEAEVRVLSGEK
jgi:putative Mn2+ efflux pump MntP